MPKSIIVDDETLEVLERVRKPGESLASVVRRIVSGKKQAAEILRELAYSGVPEAVLESTEEVVRERRRSLLKPTRARRA